MMMRIIDLLRLRIIQIRLSRKSIKRDNLEKIGSSYGGWVVPVDLLRKNSICYCVGVGEDITFDIALIKQFSCKVYAFDPTPRVISYVKDTVSHLSNFNFYDIGLWSSQSKMKFYAPQDSSHISHSITNIQNTNKYFEARCKRLSQLMQELEHKHIDLLKLDIEGAEYEVLRSIIEDELDIKIICVEFHKPLTHLNNIVNMLIEWKFNLVSVDSLFNCTFIEQGL